MKDRPRLKVLVLADRIEVALPACRALWRSGHVVGAASSSRASPVFASRAVRHKHIFPDRSAPQNVWEYALAAAVSQRAYDLVMACNDVEVLRLVTMSPSVATIPSMSSGQALVLDKAALAGICRDVGVKYPQTYVPEVPSDDAATAAAGPARAVVKAARPAALTDRGIVHVPGITPVSGPQPATSALKRYRAAGLHPILQEHVDGPKVQATIIRRRGTTSCRLVALVEQGTPAEATLQQLDSSAELGGACIAALERVADRVGYAGILQSEFVATSAGVCLIDLNPRLWGGVSFAELIGIRITERAAYDALGLPPPEIVPEVPGRRYHHAARELASLVKSPAELRSMMPRWSRGDVWDTPALDDVRPYLVRYWQQAAASWRKPHFRERCSRPRAARRGTTAKGR